MLQYIIVAVLAVMVGWCITRERDFTEGMSKADRDAYNEFLQGW
jgi:hypothetical protein